MQRRHVDTGLHDQFILSCIFFFVSDVIRGGSDNTGKQGLVFFVVVGEKPANGVNFFVLVLEEGSEISFNLGFFLRVVHSRQGFGLCCHRVERQQIFQ
jgi:hypothetical protein